MLKRHVVLYRVATRVRSRSAHGRLTANEEPQMALLTRMKRFIGSDEFVHECRHCGTTLDPEAGECPHCETGEVVAYAVE